MRTPSEGLQAVSSRFARLEAARLARIAKAGYTQAECFRPAAEAMEAVRAMGAARRSAFDPPKGALPRVAIERLADEVDRSRWTESTFDDPAPRVTHDSGWYSWVRGQPLPPIKAFEVSDR